MAPRTPLNTHISADRHWNTLVLSLDRLKAMKNGAQAKVNDVVLAIVAIMLYRRVAVTPLFLMLRRRRT